MRHIAAYLLLQIGGNASPSAADVKKVLSSVGIEADDARLETLISELKGKDVNAVSFPTIRCSSNRLTLRQLIAEGSGKLSSVPSGGAAVSSGGAAAASGGGVAAAPAAEKEEEKKEEEKVR